VSKRQSGLLPARVLPGLAMIFLAACGPATTETVSPLNTPRDQDVAVPGEAQEITSLVQQDLAEQLSVDAHAIRIAEVEATNWPDTSLGCPKAGMMYASVVTAGFRIVLEVGGQEYVYHTGPERFVRCDAAGSGQQPTDAVLQAPGESPWTKQAKQDLSAQLGIPEEAIDILSVEAVEWPDSSLGCPEPGRAYLSVVTPGYRIILGAKGTTYEYHADQSRALTCTEPQPPLQVERKSQAESEDDLVGAAKADLSQRLNISADAVELISSEPVQWPDTSLGCPQPGRLYAQVVTPGYRIVLSVDGQEYRYHTDYGTIVWCEE
jgi:hypothetical protein